MKPKIHTSRKASLIKQTSSKYTKKIINTTNKTFFTVNHNSHLGFHTTGFHTTGFHTNPQVGLYARATKILEAHKC